MKNRFVWRFLNGTVLRVARKMDQCRRMHLDREPELDDSIRERFVNGVVRHGIFCGMKYASLEAAGSALYPKLLGSYELELRPTIERIIQTGYDSIVDVGCAEGYYATGLAMRLTNTRVFAFDVDGRARRLCRQMAEVNGVAERVEIHASCTAAVIAGLPLGRRSLIISDCEGYEHLLFTPECAAALAKHDVLIEVHAFVNPDIPVVLRQRFAATHRIEAIQSTDDADKPERYPWRSEETFSREEWRTLLAEGRPGIMEWLWMTPRGDT